MDRTEQKNNHVVFLRRAPEVFVWGGLEKIMMDWFERIDYSSCRVTLAVPVGWREPFKSRFVQKNLPIDIVEFPFDFKKDALKNFVDMYKFLKSLKPSVAIFVEGAFTDFYLPMVFAGFLVTRNQVYMHENLGTPSPPAKTSKRHWGVIPGVGLWWHRARFRNNFRGWLSRKVITLSREIEKQVVDFWGYPKDKVIAAYHGIDLKKVVISSAKRQLIRRDLNIPLEDFVFIITARLSKEKRIDRAIDAFDRLTSQRNNVWLLILGDGGLRQELQQLAQQKASKERIFFLGHQDNAVEFLNVADCYVNSSDTEGLCLSLLEAMAMGVICTATYCTGPIELIQDSKAGFLVEKSIEGVFEGMQKAISLRPDERDEMIRRGLQFTQQNFDVDRLVKETLDIMQIPNLSSKGSK